MKRCTVCEGRRVTVRTEREKRYAGGGFTYTGREVERLDQCENCHGTGTEPEGPPPAGTVVYCGAPVVAPGFTSESFQDALNRARTRATMPMIPAGRGVVLVESVRTGARYRVTRESCNCPAGASHGYCKHRAAVIYAADIEGVNVCRDRVLGFDPAGHVVTAADRAAQLQGVA